MNTKFLVRAETEKVFFFSPLISYSFYFTPGIITLLAVALDKKQGINYVAGQKHLFSLIYFSEGAICSYFFISCSSLKLHSLFC